MLRWRLASWVLKEIQAHPDAVLLKPSEGMQCQAGGPHYDEQICGGKMGGQEKQKEWFMCCGKRQNERNEDSEE